MNTLFANSPDSVRIAYDRSGAGPAIVLVHGGGGNRQEWHEAGYVGCLREDFTVVTLDLRGHGESGLPTDPADYTTDKIGRDILAVADVCVVERFTTWGMSYGGKVSRYLAAQFERVAKIILIGTTVGPGAPGELRQDIEAFCAHWPPIIQTQSGGTLDLERDSGMKVRKPYNIWRWHFPPASLPDVAKLSAIGAKYGIDILGPLPHADFQP